MEQFDKLLSIMKRLREPGGCVWDREQTHESLLPYLVEESHEAFDAINSGNTKWSVEELGDLLLQVVFHCQVAAENGEYTMQDVLEGLNKKLIRRHPHVFGDENIETSEQLERMWEEIKKQEKAEKTEEERSCSPLFKKGLAHIIAKKKGFLEGKLEKTVSEAKEAVKSCPPESIGDEVGQELLLALCKAYDNDIDPERAFWSVINKLKVYKTDK